MVLGDDSGKGIKSISDKLVTRSGEELPATLRKIFASRVQKPSICFDFLSSGSFFTIVWFLFVKSSVINTLSGFLFNFALALNTAALVLYYLNLTITWFPSG